MKKTHSSARINFAKRSLSIAIAAMLAGTACSAYAEELPIIKDDFTFEQDAVVGGILLEPENLNKDITISGGSSLTISSPSEKEYAIYMLAKWGGVPGNGFVTIDSDLKIIDWDKKGVIYLRPTSHLIVKGSTNINSIGSETSAEVIDMEKSFAEFVGGISVQNSNLDELVSLFKSQLKTSKFDVIKNKTFNSWSLISIDDSKFEIANENNTYSDINLEDLEVFTSSEFHDCPDFYVFSLDDEGVIKAKSVNIKEVAVKDDTEHNEIVAVYCGDRSSVIANSITIDNIKSNAWEPSGIYLEDASNLSPHDYHKLKISVSNISSDYQVPSDAVVLTTYMAFGIYVLNSTINGCDDLKIDKVTSNSTSTGLAISGSSFILGKVSISNIKGGLA